MKSSSVGCIDLRKAIAALICGLLLCSYRGALTTNQPPSTFLLQQMLGAGGYVRGGDINPDGTRIVRTDTNVCYTWNAILVKWISLVSESTMPSANFGYWDSNTGSRNGPAQRNQSNNNGTTIGCYEAGSAPSNSSVVLVAFNGLLFVSQNKGVTFTNTGFGPFLLQPNGNFSQNGRKFAIDPINPNNVIAGTDANGVWITSNLLAGTPTWTLISGLPTSTTGAGCSVAYDLNPATQSGGSSLHVLVYCGGYTSPYESWDGGSTWTITTSGPTSMQHMVFGANGNAWATNSSGAVFQYVSGASGTLGTWTNQTTLGTNPAWHSIAVDPANPNRILIGSGGGTVNIVTVSGTSVSAQGTMAPLRTSCPDVGWLCTTNEVSMTNGDMIFDPSLSNTVMFSEGIGVWIFNPPGSGSSTYNATSTSAGIEQLVTTGATASCGTGIPTYSYWDRGVSKITNVNSYPANQGMQNAYSIAIVGGWGIDYTSTVPTTLAAFAISNQNSPDFSGLSADCGNSWLPFNSWNATVVASNTTVTSGSACFGVSACTEFQVPSTTGLSTWLAGSGTIVMVRPINTPTTGLGVLPGGYFYASIVDSTHIQIPFAFNSQFQTCNCSYILAVNTNPLSTYRGGMTVANVTSGTGGAVAVTIMDNWGITAGSTTNFPVCITGVTMATTSVVNGCWINSVVGTGIFTLGQSTFVPGDSYVSGGVLSTQSNPNAAGNIAAASPNNIIKIPPFDQPFCTTDGGQTWNTPFNNVSLGVPVSALINTATWSGSQVTFTTATATNLVAGQTFSVDGVSVSGYNKPFAATYTALSGTSGTTVIAALASNPGSSGAGGVIEPSLGWQNGSNLVGMAADRSAANTIYLYSTVSGIWKVVNCGTPTLQTASPPFGGNIAAYRLTSVPGNAGHLLFTAGVEGGATNHPASQGLYWSNNGGMNWYRVTSTGQVANESSSVGAGAIAPGSDYPTVYSVMWVGNTYGIYRSTSHASDWAGCASAACTVTWTFMGDYINGSPATATCIVGDLTTWNRFYECLGGAGAAYGQQN